MGNNKRYFITQNYVDLCKELETLAERKIKLLHPGIQPSIVDMICPSIDAWDAGAIYANVDDYDDTDINNLDRVVELGYLETH